MSRCYREDQKFHKFLLHPVPKDLHWSISESKSHFKNSWPYVGNIWYSVSVYHTAAWQMWAKLLCLVKRCSPGTMGILRTFRCLMGSMRISVTAWLALDLGASRGSLLSQGCAVSNNDPAPDREDVFVFSVQGLALFKWSCHFLQQLVQTDCRKWGRWPTSCCTDTTIVWPDCTEGNCRL